MYDLQLKEVPGNKFLTFCNGICNIYIDARSNAEYISKLSGGYNVRFVYNATHKALFDMNEVLIGFIGIPTTPVALLVGLWRSLFIMHPDCTILHTFHSHGGIHTYNALKMLEPHERKRISLVGIATAKYIPSSLAGDVQHFVSLGDIVHRFDVPGRILNNGSVTELFPHSDAPSIDHPFQSPTFEPDLKNAILKYKGTPVN